jgi:hypothetical protein
VAKVRQVAGSLFVFWLSSMILIGKKNFTIIVIIIFNLMNVLSFNSYLTI